MVNSSISSEALLQKDLPMNSANQAEPTNNTLWKKGMSSKEREERLKWLAEGRGRQGMRIVIITGKIVFAEDHQCIVSMLTWQRDFYPQLMAQPEHWQDSWSTLSRKVISAYFWVHILEWTVIQATPLLAQQACHSSPLLASK